MSARIAVVGGGRSAEHDVSLASAAGVAGGLCTAGFTPVRLTIDRHGEWRDREGRPLGMAGAVHVLRGCDAVFAALHGPHGEDGTLAALCELARLPYVGSGVAAGALAMDKWATKLVAEAVGVATAPGELLTVATAATAVAEAERHGLPAPVVVKPVRAGSSHGVALVHSAAELGPALAAALALDERVLVEQVVRGREIDVAVLGRPDGRRIIAPALEIRTEGVFDLATKYDGSASFCVPAPLTDAEQRSLEDAALGVYDAVGCRGVARVDFFLTEQGPVLNEVNTMPGFTEQSQVPRMFAAAGLGYADLVALLVGDVLPAGARRVEHRAPVSA